MVDQKYSDEELSQALIEAQNYAGLGEDGSQILMEASFSASRKSASLIGLEEKIITFLEQFIPTITEKRQALFYSLGSTLLEQRFDDDGEKTRLEKAICWKEEAINRGGSRGPKGKGMDISILGLLLRKYYDHLVNLANRGEGKFPKPVLLRISAKKRKLGAELLRKISPDDSGMAYRFASESSFEYFQRTGNRRFLMKSAFHSLDSGEMFHESTPSTALKSYKYAMMSFSRLINSGPLDLDIIKGYSQAHYGRYGLTLNPKTKVWSAFIAAKNALIVLSHKPDEALSDIAQECLEYVVASEFTTNDQPHPITQQAKSMLVELGSHL